ncbi:MAG TPA: recombinase family protein [Syntrophorhabdaceae bacterium]|nr:recombinase family protein [Syntrophorhabdaceae bacterium]
MDLDSRESTPTPALVRVAGYTRVSTTIQAREGTSLEDQRTIVERECVKRGWQLVAFFKDEGFTGRNDDRPGLRNLFDGAKRREFDVVMFTSLDRLGRNTRDVLNIYHSLLEDNAIDVVCIQQPELNTNSMTAKLLLPTLAGFAEFESAMIRKRTDAGRKSSWAQGKAIMGSVPFGYYWDKVAKKVCIDEQRRKVYDLIVSMYLDRRMSLKDVALQLNSESIAPPRKKSRGWNHVTIADILKNEAYTGKVIYNKQKFIRRNSKKTGKQYFMAGKEKKDPQHAITIEFPAFITKERFDEVQNLMKSKVNRPKRRSTEMENHFLLDNNLLFCGECGARMKRHFTPGRDTHFDYHCYWNFATKKELAEFKREKCIFRTDAGQLDATVLYEVIEFLSNPELYLKGWLREQDIEDIKRSKEQPSMKKRQEEKAYERLLDEAKYDVGREIVQHKLEEQRQVINTVSRELQKVEREHDIVQHKYEYLEEFKKAFTGSSKAKKIRSHFKIRSKIEEFIGTLSFRDKKRIVEAVISPETGGKIIVKYYRENPDDIPEEAGKVAILEGPQPDKPPVVEFDFEADLTKISNLITAIDRTSLLIKLDTR